MAKKPSRKKVVTLKGKKAAAGKRVQALPSGSFVIPRAKGGCELSIGTGFSLVIPRGKEDCVLTIKKS